VPWCVLRSLSPQGSLGVEYLVCKTMRNSALRIVFLEKGSVCMHTRCVNIQNHILARKCANVWRSNLSWTLCDTSCSDDTDFPSSFNFALPRFYLLLDAMQCWGKVYKKAKDNNGRASKTFFIHVVIDCSKLLTSLWCFGFFFFCFFWNFPSSGGKGRKKQGKKWNKLPGWSCQ